MRSTTVRTRVPSHFDDFARTPGERPNAIVAEGDARLRRRIVEALAGDGFAVTEARNGDELMALVRGAIDGRRRTPDVLVVGASGLDALAALASYVDMRCAVVFGDADDPRVVSRAQSIGTRGVLESPLDLDDLRTVAMALVKR